MSTSKVFYKGELRTSALHIASGETFITDAPKDNNGKGEAFSPTDLTATSLANCMMTIMGIAANTREIKIEKMDAEVTKIMAANPRRISEIVVNLTLKIDEDNEKNRKILTEAGINCPVAKSLHPDINQNITFNFL
ncbi:MAG: OsmC family peroxiredoxin [Sphingobacteriales bacterium]|nr:MAG: OsmC family peroxiredoxin [Sphingobacteriales bacterium]